MSAPTRTVWQTRSYTVDNASPFPAIRSFVRTKLKVSSRRLINSSRPDLPRRYKVAVSVSSESRLLDILCEPFDLIEPRKRARTRDIVRGAAVPADWRQCDQS